MRRATQFRAAAACALVALAAAPAGAATCSVSPQGVSFGNYDSLNPAPLDGVGNIHVSCDTTVSFTVALGPGSGSVDQRRMISGADQLEYNLYTNSSRTLVWGDGISGSDVSVTGETVDLPVYGRIPARQNVPAKIYADAVTVTISY